LRYEFRAHICEPGVLKVYYIRLIRLEELVKKLEVTIGLIGISLLLLAAPMRAFSQSAPQSFCTGTGDAISCTIVEGAPDLQLPTTTAVFGSISVIVMCETVDCPTPIINANAQQVSDLLGIHVATVNNQQLTFVALISDTNTEPATSFWVDQEFLSTHNLGSELDTSLVTLPEGSGTADAASLIPGSATESFVHFFLVSDGAGTSEGPDNPPVGVPEFGLSVIAVAAIGFLGIYLYRSRSPTVLKP
jgi:hypothetical protein